jgi:hypothetical protein
VAPKAVLDLKAVVVVTGEHDRGWFEQSRRVRRKQTHCSVTNHQHGVFGLKVRTEYRMVAPGEYVGQWKDQS